MIMFMVRLLMYHLSDLLIHPKVSLLKLMKMEFLYQMDTIVFCIITLVVLMGQHSEWPQT
ncbi:hypothetical protein HK19_16185 [Acetobacter persici]|nr:hypothetical protein HK19_16185 [Acetobacter persici]